MLVAILVLAMAVACFRDVVLVPQTAGSLTFLGSFFIVVLSPLFAWLWPWLEKRGRNPSKPLKSAIGLLFAALSFLPLMAAAKAAGSGAMASVWWLVLAYFVLEIGEMCLSPIGLSAVTQLSVARVVADQVGSPTPAALIADVTAQVLAQAPAQSGLWHLTTTGHTSWHGFAEAIMDRVHALGLVARPPRVVPIATREYPTPAARPAYSVLDCSKLQQDFGIALPTWRQGLDQTL
jgi:hypothetical protein